MKRTLSGSILKKKSKTEDAVASDDVAADVPSEQQEPPVASGLKPRLGGSGSAWKAGALTDAEKLLKEERALSVEMVLAGQQELRLSPDQIVDVIGTDRRDDWQDQEAYAKLKASIAANGQDTPIAVWPVDPNWRPDEREPSNAEGIQFHLIVGRRRHAILKELGRPIRALLVSQDRRGTDEEEFEALFMRFRENEERENLSAFEQLAAIGEMFKRLQEANPEQKIKAIDFAQRVGIHNSAVSRGRTVYAAREQILHACKNAYALSHRELENLLKELSVKPKQNPLKKPEKPKAIRVERRVGDKKLSVSGQGGRLSVSASGLALNKEVLTGLSDLIAEYLKKHGSN
ncbi:ParB N-terminal domain-containing protein [uncultured Roseobacter sp.]|uniref:ParB N-terminal domain-containing protein n=1 Tax=uncultured Roseobacter sp. TaxID=114847 RepID=UPI0026313E9B|nr:ParB N-terminal domain-containing protein [uncultured Roseobacter sp.]